MDFSIIDRNGVSYKMTDTPLGEGSQGTTYVLEGGKYIAKLFKKNVNDTELKSKINFLINLNLDKQIYSVPLQEITVPCSGYISEFASGMMSLSKLKDAGEDFGDWYVSTGGLLKRYGVLIKLANAIRSLHSKGLVYCDLSPNNVFVSQNPQQQNVFLIDLDNLRYKTSIVKNIYTPFYGAPEVVKNIAPNTFQSDCYSFAVIAYELLTFKHPLIGDIVDEDADLEEDALRGDLPWVEDTNDNKNICIETGLPSEYFVSGKVMKLFHKTFEEGLNNADRRPSMGEWVDALSEGLNDLLMCEECKIHYPYSNAHKCPMCGQEPQLVMSLKIQRWEENEYYDKPSNSVEKNFSLLPIVYDEIFIDKKTSKYLKAYHFLSSAEDYDLPIAQLTVTAVDVDDEMVKLTIKPLNRYTIFAKIPSLNVEQSFETEKSFRLNILSHKEMIIGVKDFSNPQRVLVI